MSVKVPNRPLVKVADVASCRVVTENKMQVEIRFRTKLGSYHSDDANIFRVSVRDARHLWRQLGLQLPPEEE